MSLTGTPVICEPRLLLPVSFHSSMKRRSRSVRECGNARRRARRSRAMVKIFLYTAVKTGITLSFIGSVQFGDIGKVRRPYPSAFLSVSSFRYSSIMMPRTIAASCSGVLSANLSYGISSRTRRRILCVPW